MSVRVPRSSGSQRPLDSIDSMVGSCSCHFATTANAPSESEFPFERILYKRFPHRQDNFVPASFLQEFKEQNSPESLRKRHKYTIRTSILGSITLLQQICSAWLVACVYMALLSPCSEGNIKYFPVSALGTMFCVVNTIILLHGNIFLFLHDTQPGICATIILLQSQKLAREYYIFNVPLTDS